MVFLETVFGSARPGTAHGSFSGESGRIRGGIRCQRGCAPHRFVTLTNLTGLSAGVFRSRASCCALPGPEVARPRGLGADSCDRFAIADRSYAGANLRPAGETILGSESSCRKGDRQVLTAEVMATGAGVLRETGFPVGRGAFVWPTLAVGR